MFFIHKIIEIPTRSRTFKKCNVNCKSDVLCPITVIKPVKEIKSLNKNSIPMQNTKAIIKKHTAVLIYLNLPNLYLDLSLLYNYSSGSQSVYIPPPCTFPQFH